MIAGRLFYGAGLLLGLLLLALPTQAQVSETTEVIIQARRLNVRAYPSINSQVVAFVRENEVYPVLDATPDESWWQINANGVIGWVSDEFVRVRTTVYVPVTPTATPQPLMCDTGYDLFFDTHFTTLCAAAPVVTTGAAYQPFEDGFMIWLQSTGAVYAFSSDGALRVAEADYALLPDAFEPAPPHLLVPVRGFGRVWQNIAPVRGWLGWAREPESGYTAQVQRGFSTVDGRPLVYLLRPDGAVIIFDEIANGWYTAQ